MQDIDGETYGGTRYYVYAAVWAALEERPQDAMKTMLETETVGEPEILFYSEVQP